MSILLALIPALFACCIIACYVLSLRRPEFIRGTATVTVTLILILWLVAGLNLPITLGGNTESNAIHFSVWMLRVDEIAWQLGLSLLILIESLLLVGLPRLQNIESVQKLPARQRILFPAMLLIVVISLLGTWLSSGPGLLAAWSITGVVWLLLLWLATDGRIQFGDLLLRAGFLLSGVVFLWLALAALEIPIEQAFAGEGWTTQSIFWVTLAIVIQFGAIPLHWWRPLNWSMSPSLASIIHLVPSILGASLLARVVTVQEPGMAVLFLTTILGLLGLLVGAVIAWSRLDDTNRVVTGLVLAQAGMTILIGFWVGPKAVIAQSKIFILALGSLYIANQVPRQPYSWNNLVPLAALASIPLTVGFTSLVTLYSTWLTGIGFLLTLVTMALYILFIGAALILLWPREQTLSHPKQTTFVRVRTSVGLLLPSLALISLPTSFGAEFSQLSWLFILFAVVGGVALGSYVRKDSEIQSGLGNAFRLRVPSNTSLTLFRASLSRFASSIRGVSGIFEGEGGLFWLLIFIVIFWLAIGS